VTTPRRAAKMKLKRRAMHRRLPESAFLATGDARTSGGVAPKTRCGRVPGAASQGVTRGGPAIRLLGCRPMHRLRSLGRTVQGAIRGLLARPFRAVVSILRPVGAALAALAGTAARVAGPITRPLRRLVRSLRGSCATWWASYPRFSPGPASFWSWPGSSTTSRPHTSRPRPGPARRRATSATSASPEPYTLPPLVTASPSTSGNASPGASGTSTYAIATRVAIPALNIDDAVVASPPTSSSLSATWPST